MRRVRQEAWALLARLVLIRRCRVRPVRLVPLGLPDLRVVPGPWVPRVQRGRRVWLAPWARRELPGQPVVLALWARPGLLVRRAASVPQGQRVLPVIRF